MWECQKWAHLRKLVFEAINAYVNQVTPNDLQRQQRIVDMCQKPYVANCGVMLETRHFREECATLSEQCHQFHLEDEPRHRLSERQRAQLEQDDEGRVMAFTDGTACHPDDRRRRRAAWGTYYADDHPWNRCGPILGNTQTVYRAELTAVDQVVKSALEPTHIVCDCEAVVNCAADVSHDNHEGNHKGDHADVSRNMQETVREKPLGYFKIT